MMMTEVNGMTTNVPTNNAVENEKEISTGKIKKLTNEEDEITLEDLAPDGGWGWIIAFAMILVIVSIIIMNDVTVKATHLLKKISFFIYK